MAIQWLVPVDFAGGIVGGAYVNETASGGLEFLTPFGSYINEQAAAAASVTSLGGLHHIMEGMGDPGNARLPQTLHTIEQGVAV